MKARTSSPQESLMVTREEIAECVELFRWELYNRGEPCGATAIRRRLDEELVRPLPSTSTIGRILRRRGLVEATSAQS